jgi:methylated-DNA-[protein]-cysteine S-methyltransferase
LPAPGFSLFDTAIGRCGIAWSAAGIVALQLPEASEDATRARLGKTCPAAAEGLPPPTVEAVITEVCALLRGASADLSGIVLDMAAVPDFERRVYAVARQIPAGQTLTYGAVALRLGMPGAARAVGRALGRNPFAIIVPCHRVVAAGGAMGGFSAGGGVATKRRILAIEGVRSDEPMLPGLS